MTTLPDLGHRSAAADRWTHRAMMAVLWLVILAGAFGWLGVSTGETSASASGLDVTVAHATVARPGLATPFSVRVVRSGGLPDQITVTLPADYLALFDTNGLEPTPSASHVDADRVIWTFEPPDGAEVLTVTYDARLQPSLRLGRRAATVTVTAGGTTVRVPISTWVLP